MIMNSKTHAKRRSARGLTMVELLVAIAIGMLIMTAMAVLFANNSRSRTETERASQKIENGRFALDLIRTDLQHAGFMSVFDPRDLPSPTSASELNICETSMTNLEKAMPLHVQGYDNVSGSTVECLTDVVPGTDVLVVRRAAACVAGTTNCEALGGRPGFQASSCNSADELSGPLNGRYKFSTSASDFVDPNGVRDRNCDTTVPTGCITGVANCRAPVYRYMVRIYYVASNDQPNDGIPTLKRAELDVNGSNLTFRTASLVQGVEDMQVEYGMDSSPAAGDGNPDIYATAQSSYLNCTAGVATCETQWRSVVSAKVHVLSRNIDGSADHIDAKTYYMGKKSDGTDQVAGPFNTTTYQQARKHIYKRSVFQEVVRMNNVAARRFVPS